MCFSVFPVCVSLGFNGLINVYTEALRHIDESVKGMHGMFFLS